MKLDSQSDARGSDGPQGPVAAVQAAPTPSVFEDLPGG